MRLYLAGAESTGIKCVYALAGLPDLAFLSSYFYLRKQPKIIEYCHNEKIPHFLDSGAFSAMHSGAEINIDAYIEFIKEHGAKFEKVAALDCIGDYKGTEKNLQYMRGKGVNPIPVFHTNEPFDYLDNLLKENDYLCLGVTGSKLRQPQIIAWLIEVFKHRRDINPDCKMHGFALTSAKIMKFFEWHTCDSSTWLAGQKFSRIMDSNLKQYHRRDWHKIEEVISKDVFITERGSVDRLPPIWRHNAQKMLEYVSKINTLKGKAVVSPRPTV